MNPPIVLGIILGIFVILGALTVEHRKKTRNLRPDIKEATVDIEVCARCKAFHSQIRLKRFLLSKIGRYTHWGICPDYGEPILMRIK